MSLLHGVRAEGLARIDDIVERDKLPDGLAPSDARHYLNRVIQYDLGGDKLEGLYYFFERLRAVGLLQETPQLRFLEAEAETVS